MSYYSNYLTSFSECPIQSSPWIYFSYFPLTIEAAPQFQTLQPVNCYQPSTSETYSCLSYNHDSNTISMPAQQPQNTNELAKTRVNFVETLQQKTIEKPSNRKVCSNERFVQKNVEANSLNHVFSFISNENKTQRLVMKIFQNNKFKCQQFYQCWKQLRSGNRKPVTRQFLDWAFGRDDQKGLDRFISKKLKDCQGFTSAQFTKCNRILMHHFLKEEKSNVLLTSNKIRSTVYLRHLRKYRELLIYFVNKQ